MSRSGLVAAGIVAIAFGVVTIREGGMVLLGSPAALRAAGNYVPFVLWFNFLAGFAYVLAGAGLWARRRWAAPLAMGIAALTVLVFAAFGVHVLTGGAYEMRTVFAMTLRSVVWVVLAALAHRALRSGR